MGDESDSEEEIEWKFKRDDDYWRNGALKRDIDYCKDNWKRKTNVGGKAMYIKESTGTLAKSAILKMGLLSAGVQGGIYENDISVGCAKIGVIEETETDFQVGVEAEVSVLSAGHRIGPCEVKAKVLDASFKAGLGRNTGAMVKADLISVSGRAGPVSATLGVKLDTGASIGADGIQAYVAGTGARFTEDEWSVSLLGSSVSIPPIWNWF